MTKMDDYHKLTDVEILDTLSSLKKELMAELCKLPEWSENQTVNLNASENMSSDSRETKFEGEVITSLEIQIGEHTISQSPSSSISFKAEDINIGNTSTHKYNVSEVDDIYGNGFDNVSPWILPDSKPDISGSANTGEQSLVPKETINPVECKENKCDIGDEYQMSFMKREDVKKEEVVKQRDEVQNIKTDERMTINLTELDLKNSIKDEDDDTRQNDINFKTLNLVANCSKSSTTGKVHIGHRKHISPPLNKNRHRNIADQEEDIHLQPTINENLCTFSSAQCGKSFDTKEHTTRHLQIHKEYISLQRNHCKKSFIQERNLNGESSYDQIRPYEYSRCKKRFTRSETLKNHLRIHDGILPYESHQCKQRFTLNGNLNRHLRIHDEIRPYECSQCEKRFTNSGNLKRHLRIHYGIRPYECSQCKKRFIESGILKRHLRIHDGNRPYECSRCKKRFTESGSLKRHLRIHDGNRPYECSQCKKRFTESGSLKNHLRIHDEIRPYECSQCKKRFTVSGSLKRHLRIHDGNRPYECSQCKKRFTESGSLKNHLRIHDGIRPYECHQCKQRFTFSGSLKTHLRIHDEIRPYECSQCK